MIDKKLKSALKQNVGAILDIMERNGVDVSKYRKLAEDLKEQDKRKRENKRARNKKYKASATAFLNAFAYYDIRAEARQEETSNLQALKDCLKIADELTDRLQDFLSVATAIKTGKKPYYKKAQTPRLKSLENRPSIAEAAQKRQEERREQAKQEYITYYSENWFFLLLDVMKKETNKKEQIQ